MKKSTVRKLFMAVVITLSLSLSSAAEERLTDTVVDQGDAGAMLETTSVGVQKRITDATTVYSALLKRTDGGVPESVIKNSKCVVVFPKLVYLGVIFGGKRGNGVASCKLQNNKWSQLAFLTFSEGSIGAQVGFTTSDLVLYFIDDKAVDVLKQGELSFDADTSVVAGNFDRFFDTAEADIVAYQHNSGAFVGVSLSVGDISEDSKATLAYYGKRHDLRAILSGEQTGLGEITNTLTPLL